MTGQRVTPTQANASLPLVRAIASDVVLLTARLEDAEGAYRAEKAKPLPSQIVLNDGRRAIRWMRTELDACSAELGALSASVEDAAQGVVDIAGLLEDRPVLFCWRLGEEMVEGWHLDGETHADRRPLPEIVPA